MVGIVAGLGLGLQNGSSAQLGANGLLGNAQFGRGNERVFVNAATGNLVVQQRDEFLSGSHLNINLNRTYNSLGQADDDNGDNWRLGYARRVQGLSGTVNTAGSKIIRVAEDGSELSYVYQAQSQSYVAKAAHGGTYTLTYDTSKQTWQWHGGANRVTETYDAKQQGRLLQINHQDGDRLSFSYNAAGLITQIRSSNGDALYIDYDTAAGRQANIVQLRSETKVGGQVQTQQKVRYAYDSANRLSKVTVDLSPADGSISDGHTYVTEYRYQGDSRRISQISQADGSLLAFDYVEVKGQWRIASAQDIRSGTDKRMTQFAYAANGLSTTITDPAGHKTTLTYDAVGKLLSLVGPAVNGQSQTIRYAYDAAGNVASSVDALGHTTVYRYDGHGNRLYERDALGNTTEWAYNASHQLLSETRYVQADPDGEGAGLPQGAQVTRYVYDEQGRARFVVSAQGRVTEQRYDGQGRVVSQHQYASVYAGSEASVAALSGWVAQQALSLSQRTDTQYDLRGQVSRIIRYASVDAKGVGIQAGSSQVDYVYDAHGNILQTIDRLGGQSHYVYDGLNRLISQKDALGNVTTTAYLDAAGQTQITLANGLSTVQQYDRGGLLISSQAQTNGELLGKTSHQYNLRGQLISSTDPLGQRSAQIYDAAGRRVASLDAAGGLIEYRYDDAGQVIGSIAYATAVSAALLKGDPASYDLAQLRPAANAADRREHHVYDAAGRLLLSVAADGAMTQYEYDGVGQRVRTTQYATRLSAAQLTALAAATGPLKPSDANLQVSANASQDRVARQFYDADGHLLATLDAEGFLTEHGYDGSGQRISSVRYANVSPAAQRASGTLDQLRPKAHGTDQKTSHYYDGQKRLQATVDAAGYLTEYRYDDVGNQVAEIRYATKAKAGTTLAAIRPTSHAEATSAFVP